MENEKTKANLTVIQDKTMDLEFTKKSGTNKELLYNLGVNGVYENNDLNAPLIMNDTEHEMGLRLNNYEDEFFPKDIGVVNWRKILLLGRIDKVYSTNCTMYVPAEKGLNGYLSGVFFENRKFNADVFAKIYWDEMKKLAKYLLYKILRKQIKKPA